MNIGPRKKFFRWKGRVCTEAVYKSRCARVKNGKKRKRESSPDPEPDPAELSDTKLNVRGCRIVDIGILIERMICVSCSQPLSLSSTEKEDRQGLASLLHVRCQNCFLVNQIPTSEEYQTVSGERKAYDVNSKLVLGALHAGLGNMHINKLLCALNIPAVNAQLFKRYESEVGFCLEELAKESCDAATDLERKLTIEKAEELQTMLPKELQSGFILPNGEVITAETLIRLFASYDMGWSKRGTGRSYDSLNGYGALIGYLTKLIFDYGTRNRKCRSCDTGNSPNDHDCRLNYSGSAKNMENDLANDLVNSSEILKRNNCEIGVFIGDDDSSTIARIRTASDHQIVKMSDINHTSKGVTKKLFAIQKDHKELSNAAIAYLQRCFSYAIAQNKGDSAAVSAAVRQIPYHAFNQHENCGSWCGWKRDKENYEHNTIVDGFSEVKLFDGLIAVFNKLADNADKYAHGASSNQNENLNAMMASKAPKSRCYSTSASSDYRFAATVLCKNLGEEYIHHAIDMMRISPGEYTAKYIDSVTKTAEARATKIQSQAFKRRRLELKQWRAVLRMRKETSEGVTYESGMGLLDTRAVAPTTSAVKVIEQPRLDPSKSKPTDFSVVFFDLETAGFSKTAEILQIGARCENESFSVYVTPRQPIPLAASEVNGLVNINRELFFNGAKVASHPLRVALERFLQFLITRNKPCALTAHNCSFDSVRLLNAINRTSMMAKFRGVIAGFTDTLPIVRQILNRRDRCKETDLAVEFLNVSSDGAHNALWDVEILQKLAHHFGLTDDFLVSKMITLEMEIAKNIASTTMRDIARTLIPVRGVLSDGMIQKMASAGISFETIVDAHTSNRSDGILSLLSESVNGKPRVTKTSTIIKDLVDFMDEIMRDNE